jgi:hypothetical protein
MRVARKAQAAQFAANVPPIIRDIQAAGYAGLNAIAGQLNAPKVATANGGWWGVDSNRGDTGLPAHRGEGIEYDHDKPAAFQGDLK